jgi:hypothetical protein
MSPNFGQVDMPRIRSVKPEIWDSPDVMSLNNGHALLWVWLITQADDDGRLHGDPDVIARRFRRLTTVHVAAGLAAMQARGMLTTYQEGGTRYLALTHWRRHQHINRPLASSLPPPPEFKNGTSGHDADTTHGGLTEDSRRTHGRLTDVGIGKEGNLRERKGRESEGGETIETPIEKTVGYPTRNPELAQVAQRIAARSRRNAGPES